MAINTFNPQPQRDGTAVTSTVNTSELLAKVDNPTYFPDADHIYRVDIRYEHEQERQEKIIYHYADEGLTGLIAWTPTARDGTWNKISAKVFDFDGARAEIGRDVIGTGEDLVLI